VQIRSPVFRGLAGRESQAPLRKSPSASALQVDALGIGYGKGPGIVGPMSIPSQEGTRMTSEVAGGEVWLESFVQGLANKTDKSEALPLARQLVHVLAEEKVSYCHWKSNATLELSLRGQKDLDLLINRRDASRFVQILHHLGFKRAEAPQEDRLPGIQDYYGYDAESGLLIHVHAHFQLIVGDDMAKNYRLPVESAFLSSASEALGVKVPTPEFEYAVLVLRMVLKHCAWDSILSLSGKVARAARAEMEYLESRIDRARISEVIEQELPYLGVPLFEKCVATLHPDCPLWTRVMTTRELEKRLRIWGRQSGGKNTVAKVSRRVSRALRRRLFGSLPRKSMAHGGTIIALIGGDGAGKTTAVQGLSEWLSQDFETATFHLGKPPWSLTTYAVRGSFKALRIIARGFGWEVPFESRASNGLGRVPGYAELLRDLCTARDRFRAFLKARRLANNGALSICDRFPLREIKLMDGIPPREALSGARVSRVKQWILQAEKAYHEVIPAPELIFVLRMNPRSGVARKPEEESSYVLARCREIWEFDWRTTSAQVIDANLSSREVLSALKSAIWQTL
jgi:hypothetical protein